MEPNPATGGTGRVERWRAQATVAADRYQQRAQEQPILALPLTFIARYTARQGVLLASASAFRLFLWLMPLSLLVAGILSAISYGNSANIEAASKSAGVTGAASQQAAATLSEGHQSWWVAVLVGGVLFLWGTRTLIRNMTMVNAHAWGAPVPKARQKDVLVTTAMVAGGFLVLIPLGLFVWRLDGLFVGGVVLAIGVQAAATVAIWFFVCSRLPDRRRGWYDLIPGCLLFGIGLSLMNAFSRIYLPRRFEHSAQLYGALGIAGVILAWMLLVGQLLVSCALVNSIWSDYLADRRGAERSAENAAKSEMPGTAAD